MPNARTRVAVTCSSLLASAAAIATIGAQQPSNAASSTAPILSSSHATSSSISLAWTADGKTVTGYDVLVRGVVKATLGTSARTYTATGLAASTQYKFVVRADLAAGGTEESNPIWKSTTSSTAAASPAASPTASASPTPTPSPTASPSPTADTKVTKVLVFIEENHSLAQAQAGMPYSYGLAKTYGYASSYTAIRHPSLPNYIAIASGQTYSITDDNPPSSHKLTGKTVFGQARTAGKTAKVYADGMQANCALVNGGTRYAVKHNPWAYFTATNERQACNLYDVPETRLQADITNGALPKVGMVIPNLCNDAHDCSLATADNWFKTRMQAIMAGPDWKSGHLAVILTADEDDGTSGNRVLTTVAHPALHGKVVTSALTHYSLSAFLSRMSGSTPLANAASAPSLASAFGLAVTP